MKLEFKKYIGVLFILLYSFPLVYQTVHIIKHQTHEIHAHSHCVNHEADSAPFIHSKNTADEDCPICDFQFTLFDEITVNTSTNTCSYNKELKFFFAYHNIINYSRNSNSPRAPPLFS